MFIRKATLTHLLSTMVTQIHKVAELTDNLKNLKGDVKSLDREIDELAERQQYNLGIPLINVVRALVKETGKEPEIVPSTPAKVILSTPDKEE